jgi:hypothetical protein
MQRINGNIAGWTATFVQRFPGLPIGLSRMAEQSVARVAASRMGQPLAEANLHFL